MQSVKTRLGADCGSDHELLSAKFRLKWKKVEFVINTELVMAQGSPGGSMVKNRPAVQKAQVQPPGWEDLLEKEMATYSMDKGAWQATVPGVTRVRRDLAAKPPPAIMGY